MEDQLMFYAILCVLGFLCVNAYRNERMFGKLNADMRNIYSMLKKESRKTSKFKKNLDKRMTTWDNKLQKFMIDEIEILKQQNKK